MKIVVLESQPQYERLAPAQEAEWEQKIADVLAGKHPPVLILPPGRRLAVVEVPNEQPAPPAPVKAQPPRQKEFKA